MWQVLYVIQCDYIGALSYSRCWITYRDRPPMLIQDAWTWSNNDIVTWSGLHLTSPIHCSIVPHITLADVTSAPWAEITSHHQVHVVTPVTWSRQSRGHVSHVVTGHATDCGLLFLWLNQLRHIDRDIVYYPGANPGQPGFVGKMSYVRGLPTWSSIKNHPLFNRRHAAEHLLAYTYLYFNSMV